MHQIVTNEGIPFKILTENGMMLQQEVAINKAAQEGKRGINVEGPFDSDEEMRNYFLSI